MPITYTSADQVPDDIDTLIDDSGLIAYRYIAGDFRSPLRAGKDA